MRGLRSRRIYGTEKSRKHAFPEAGDAGLLGTSKHRWDEWGFRIPDSGGSAGLATNRVSSQPGSRRILESPAEGQEVWTVDSESIGQVF
jgi:hypothetical protein